MSKLFKIKRDALITRNDGVCLSDETRDLIHTVFENAMDTVCDYPVCDEEPNWGVIALVLDWSIRDLRKWSVAHGCDYDAVSAAQDAIIAALNKHGE